MQHTRVASVNQFGRVTSDDCPAGVDYVKCAWSADLWTRDAVDWISAQAAKQPWFLYLAYTSPHAGAVGTPSPRVYPPARRRSGHAISPRPPSPAAPKLMHTQAHVRARARSRCSSYRCS